MKRILSLFFVALVIGTSLQAQVRKEILVSQEYIFMTLHEIFSNLERRYDLVIDFYEEDLPDKLMRTQSFDKTPLNEVIEQLVSDFDVEFIIRNHETVIIRKKGTQLVAQEVRDKTKPTRFNFTLNGKIIDTNTGETLPFSTILIVSTGTGAAANVDGNFTLFNLPTDTSTVLLQYLGYRTRYLKLEPGMIDESNYAVLEMEPLVSLLEEVIVTDQKEHMIKASDAISKVSVSPTQLAALPSLGEKDIFRSLQLLPGISATNETSSGLFVRGGTPDQNLVLFDGFTVYHVDHFYGFFSAFNANAIKNVQLYKGGFEAKYGGRISSVVDMTGKNGNLNEFQSSIGVSALSANMSFEAPFDQGRGSTFFSYRRSFTDIIQSGLYDSIYGLFQEDESNAQPQRPGFGDRGFGQFEQEPSFYFYDLNAKVTYRPSRKDILSFSFYNGKDNLDNSTDINSSQFGGFGGFGGDGGGGGFNNDRTDLSNWGNVGTSFKWGRQWNPNLYTNSVLSYSNYFSDRDFFSATEVTRQDTSFTIRNGNIERNDISDFTLRVDNEYTINAQNKLSFGTQITLNNVNYSQVNNDTLEVINTDDSGWTNAVYLQNEWSPTDQFRVNAGLRLTNFSITDDFYFEPRVSGSYQATERLKFKAAWGLYNQYVTRVVKEDVSQGSQDFWLLANDDLNPVSSSEHFIAGLSYETNQFLFDVEGFYKDLDGLSEYTLRLTNNFRSRSVDLDELFFEGTGYSRGIETLLQKKFGTYTGWMSYTISEVIHDFPELSSSTFPALHDQTHEFKFVNSLRVGRWNFSGTWVYATGKPYTSPTGAYELTYLDGTTETYINVGEKNAYRLPDYHRLDVSAVVNVPIEDLGVADIGFSIFNLYNRSNVWYKTFEIIEGDFITSDVNTIGITPNFYFTLIFKPMRIVLPLLFFVLIAGCEDQVFDFETTDTLVIEAYIHDGQPVSEININQLIPLISDSSESYEINDANVRIEWMGSEYALIPGTEDGVYIYPNNDLQINVGDDYTITVDYFDKITSATTTVPAKPTGLDLSTFDYEVPLIDDFEDIFNLRDRDPLEVYWDNSAGNYYYILIENIESNPEEINQLNFGFDRGNFQLISPPTNLDVYNLGPGDVTQFGTHRLILYRVNQEYVDLYDSSEQDSRNLSEPLTNIENGVGIFTAFSSDTVFFEVSREF